MLRFLKGFYNVNFPMPEYIANTTGKNISYRQHSMPAHNADGINVHFCLVSVKRLTECMWMTFADDISKMSHCS